MFAIQPFQSSPRGDFPPTFPRMPLSPPLPRAWSLLLAPLLLAGCAARPPSYHVPTGAIRPWTPPAQVFSCPTVDTFRVEIDTREFRERLGDPRDAFGRSVIRGEARDIEVVPKAWSFQHRLEHDDCLPEVAWRRILVRTAGDRRDSLLLDTFLVSQRDAREHRFLNTLTLKRLDGECLQPNLEKLIDGLKAQVQRLESVRKSNAWSTVSREERLEWIQSHLRAAPGKQSLELQGPWDSASVIVQADTLRLAPNSEATRCP